MQKTINTTGMSGSDYKAVPARPTLSVVIPCHNEQGNLEKMCRSLEDVCGGLEYEIVFVDDSSTDASWQLLERLHAADPRITALRLAWNSGQQAALRAGLDCSRGQWVITMDADLQHPPACISRMMDAASKGADVVYMANRGSQRGILKTLFSKLFYAFYNRVAGAPIEPGAGDFRLQSRRVVDVLKQLPERNLVLRTVIPALGFPSTILEYRPDSRFAGERQYTFGASLGLARKSVFHFTTFPLDLGYRFGWILAGGAFSYAIWTVYLRLFTERTVPGYTDIMCATLGLGGVTLIYLGVLGKYLTVVLDHLKGRPEYLVDRRLEPEAVDRSDSTKSQAKR